MKSTLHPALTSSKVAAILLKLEFDGLIRSLPGKRYKINWMKFRISLQPLHPRGSAAPAMQREMAMMDEPMKKARSSL